jgi:hypothetical protein
MVCAVQGQFVYATFAPCAGTASMFKLTTVCGAAGDAHYAAVPDVVLCGKPWGAERHAHTVPVAQQGLFLDPDHPGRVLRWTVCVVLLQLPRAADAAACRAF